MPHNAATGSSYYVELHCGSVFRDRLPSVRVHLIWSRLQTSPPNNSVLDIALTTLRTYALSFSSSSSYHFNLSPPLGAGIDRILLSAMGSAMTRLLSRPLLQLSSSRENRQLDAEPVSLKAEIDAKHTTENSSKAVIQTLQKVVEETP